MTSANSHRYIVLAVLVVAGGLVTGVAPTTAAPASQIQDIGSEPVAEDVTVNKKAVTQELSFTVTLADNTTQQVDIDLSTLADGGVTSRVETIRLNNSDVAYQHSGINSANRHSIQLTERGTGSSNTTVDVTVRYDHNTSALSPAAVGERSIPIAASDDSHTEAAVFSVVYDTSTVARSVATDIAYNGTTVYAGEDDLTFIDTNGREVDPASLEKTAGSNKGTPLQLDAVDDLNTGTYAEQPTSERAGFSVVLQEPRITTAELQLGGEAVTAISADSGSLENATATTAWNFPEADTIKLTVTDPSGTNITGEVVDSPVLNSSDGEDSVSLDMQNEDAGEYTLTFESTNDLTIKSDSFTLVDAGGFGIETDSNVTQGNYANFTVSGAVDGSYHLVTVDASAFREDLNTNEHLFRNVRDTEDVGYATADGVTSESAGLDTVNASNAAYAYAVVQVDGTEAGGQIDTALLKETDVTVEAYSSRDTGGRFYDPRASTVESLADAAFDVDEASVTLTEPSTQYTIGQTVTVRGETAGVDAVRLYAYDEGRWLPVAVDANRTLSVDDENTFGASDVELSAGNASGNQLLSFEGQYRIGVIDAAAVTPSLTADAGVSGAIDAPEFAAAVSDQQPLTTEVGQLTAEVETYNNQIATADATATVTGIAPTDTVSIVFIDERGTTVVREVSAEQDPINLANVFEQEDIPIGSLHTGPVTVHVISPGRDAVYGDGTRVTDVDELRAHLTVDRNVSGEQVRDRLAAVTTDVNASDDQVVSERFRLTDERVSIDRVGPSSQSQDGVSPVVPGEQMVIQGHTNRDPETVDLTVTVVNAAFDPVKRTLVREWDASGSYAVGINTTRLEPGLYSVEVAGIQATDRVDIAVVADRNASSPNTSAHTDTNTTTGTEADRTRATDPSDNQSDAQTEVRNDSQQETTTTENRSESDLDVPIFGVSLAGLAVVLIGLLATRR